MLEMRTKSRSNVVADFKKVIRPEQNPIEFIDEKLEPYSRAYAEILDQSFSGNSFEVEINQSFSWLNRIDNSDWVPAAIYYLSKYRNEPEKLKKFFELLERLAAVKMINRISINYRIARYAKVLAAVDAGVEFSEDSPLRLSPEEKSDAKTQLSGPLYMLSKIRVMVLLRLDSELSDGMAVYNHPKITVEHVMPQNPADNSQWKEWCPSEEEHAELVHCIGNLALLSRSKNSAANNYEFDKKKTAYFESKGSHTAFVLTNGIIKETEWTPAIIRKRQNMLLGKLAEAWDL
jgi:hypothetical protein